MNATPLSADSHRESTQRRARFTVVLGLLTATSIAAWCINAIHSIGYLSGIDILWAESVFPRMVNEWLTIDVSTITTALPVLVFGMPFLCARRLQRGQALPEWADPSSQCYPPGFPMGATFLGLFGTLFGLLIAMKQSQLDAGVVAGHQSAIERLMSGGGTALVSSMAGIIAYYLATPGRIPTLFRNVMTPGRPTSAGLSETLRELRSQSAVLCNEIVGLTRPVRELDQEFASLVIKSTKLREALPHIDVASLVRAINSLSKSSGTIAANFCRLIRTVATIEGRLQRLESAVDCNTKELKTTNRLLAANAEQNERFHNELMAALTADCVTSRMIRSDRAPLNGASRRGRIQQ